MTHSDLVVESVDHRLAKIHFDHFQCESEATRTATDDDGRVETTAREWTEISRG